ncbi:PhzF family phenazine biosynthesis protein [Methylomicrobium lacus]|uniref:PhzF family phenazine biosynthesis protein n=1 Tax=Methylomicrobium lacus TaxID=136992 RepID=UPI00045E7447|nr:PhzF family phenazine biosynthesis protein [Methylomicrobium lacus]
MKYQYYIADVFTRQVFNGAQIAVFPNADGLGDVEMQKIANELNLWETVFVFHPGGDLRKLRMFSPKAEVDFAGHPIIATAYVLGLCGDIKLDDPVTPVVFEQNAGPIEVNITAENGKPMFVQFTNKVSSIIDRFAPTDEELAAVLSIQQADLDHIKYSARLVACGMPYLVVPVWKYETVRKARFNYAAWSRSAAPQTAAQEILLFAPKTPYSDSDFNLRLLGPHIGHDDDPPVGAAVPAFASYLCSFEQTRKGTHTFAVDRGDENSRRSVINIEMDHKGKAQLTLRVGGSAVIFAQGTVFLPD